MLQSVFLLTSGSLRRTNEVALELEKRGLYVADLYTDNKYADEKEKSKFINLRTTKEMEAIANDDRFITYNTDSAYYAYKLPEDEEIFDTVIIVPNDKDFKGYKKFFDLRTHFMHAYNLDIKINSVEAENSDSKLDQNQLLVLNTILSKAMVEEEDNGIETNLEYISKIIYPGIPARGHVFVIIGPSGAGKTTLEKELVAVGLVEPIIIWSNRKLRKDDPHWMKPLNNIYPSQQRQGMVLNKYKIDNDVLEYHYAIPSSMYNGNFIVSFLDPESAKNVYDKMLENGFVVHILNLDRENKEVVRGNEREQKLRDKNTNFYPDIKISIYNEVKEYIVKTVSNVPSNTPVIATMFDRGLCVPTGFGYNGISNVPPTINPNIIKPVYSIRNEPFDYDAAAELDKPIKPVYRNQRFTKPVITAEVTDKWYDLKIMDTRGQIFNLSTFAIKKGYKQFEEWTDNLPRVQALFDYAVSNNFLVDYRFLEALLGRWITEKDTCANWSDIEDYGIVV